MPKIVITSSSKKKILNVISGWQGKLSWSLLCERVTKELGLESIVSRHTLLAYEDVKIAFEEKKAWLKEQPFSSSKKDDMQLQDAYSRIDTLEAKVRSLEAEKTALTEQFVRWQYNLYYMSNNMDELNKELPEGVNIEELRIELERKPVPSNINMSKLNQPLTKLTRADDNKRKRT
jgi:predicted nuclease with TOPRIM domain